jgi:hypothetical protein
MAIFGQWKYTTDRETTVLAYKKAEPGAADMCDCASCRNFVLARALVFPVEFLGLLDQLGIDPHKDAELYSRPHSAQGFQECAGWFHFVGTLEETGDFPPVDFGHSFTAWMCRAAAPRLISLGDLPAVQLEFRAELVPWLLAEPEPKYG